MFSKKYTEQILLYLIVTAPCFLFSCADKTTNKPNNAGEMAGTMVFPIAGEEVNITGGDETIAGEMVAGETSAGTVAGTVAGENVAGTMAGTMDGGDMVAGEMNEPPCDIMEVINNNSCAASGCHSTPIQGNLDLSTLNQVEGMLDAPSHTNGCEGRLLIDSRQPSRSLLLQAIGAHLAPLGEEDSCQLVMPPGSAVSEEDQQCASSWVDYMAGQVERPPMNESTTSSLESALRKVKTLLQGKEITAEEITLAQESGFRAVVETWVTGDAFESKMLQFFTLALQQRVANLEQNQFGRLRGHRSRRGKIELALQEVIPRTALNIMKEGQNFNRIATTRTWMMNTASMVALLFPDQSSTQRTIGHFASGDESDVPGSLRNRIAQRRWHIPGLTGTCNLRQSDVLEMMNGFVNNNRCDGITRSYRFPEVVLEDRYFTDWRLVEITTNGNLDDEEITPFYDVLTLQEASTLNTRLARVGYFTSSAFFNQWPTNVDNQFRVTINQALLSGLHIGFASTEPTEPIQMDALDSEHAEPGSECYGCHKQLDPMRVYFGASYNADYRLPSAGNGQERLFSPLPRASFAFRGVTDDGGRVGRLGNNIANHPRWSSAWVQKVCQFANSNRCDESDPVFVAIKDEFASEKRFLPMLISILSSPLVTGLEEVDSRESAPIISITRRDHICSLLSERLGRPNLCSVNRIRQVIGLIPNDDYARGAVDFSQPALASPFFYAAAEAVCEATATVIVTGNNEFFSSNDPESTMVQMVTRLMSLPDTLDRHNQVLQFLQNHFTTLRNEGVDSRSALRSVFTVACLSPDVMGVGL